MRPFVALLGVKAVLSAMLSYSYRLKISLGVDNVGSVSLSFALSKFTSSCIFFKALVLLRKQKVASLI